MPPVSVASSVWPSMTLPSSSPAARVLVVAGYCSLPRSRIFERIHVCPKWPFESWYPFRLLQLKIFRFGKSESYLVLQILGRLWDTSSSRLCSTFGNRGLCFVVFLILHNPRLKSAYQLLGLLQRDCRVCLICRWCNLVDIDSCFHIFCFLAKLKGVHSFLEVWDGLRHGANDSSLRVSTQGWLKNPCDFGVTIVNELLGRAAWALT